MPFPDFSDFLWINAAYSDFINKFLRAIDCVASI